MNNPLANIIKIMNQNYKSNTCDIKDQHESLLGTIQEKILDYCIQKEYPLKTLKKIQSLSFTDPRIFGDKAASHESVRGIDIKLNNLIDQLSMNEEELSVAKTI